MCLWRSWIWSRRRNFILLLLDQQGQKEGGTSQMRPQSQMLLTWRLLTCRVWNCRHLSTPHHTPDHKYLHVMSREADAAAILQLIVNYLVMLSLHSPTRIKGAGRSKVTMLKVKVLIRAEVHNYWTITLTVFRNINVMKAARVGYFTGWCLDQYMFNKSDEYSWVLISLHIIYIHIRISSSASKNGTKWWTLRELHLNLTCD